jgi:hypothetical protein
MIKNTDILLTSSPQAVLESLASKGRPIYIKREDYSDNFDALFRSLNVPVLDNLDINQVFQIIKTINNINYEKPLQNCNKISKFIKESLNL